MTKQKKIYRRDIQAYDEANQENASCFIRQLEMEIDHLTAGDGYTMQFFRDLELYGLKEAIDYLKSHCNGKLTAPFVSVDYLDLLKIAQVIELKIK